MAQHSCPQTLPTSNMQDVYEAERLIRKRGRGNKTEYLVKWKGWSHRSNTWEPIGHILDRRLIDQFEEEQGRLKKQRLDPKQIKSIDLSEDESRDKEFSKTFECDYSSYDKPDNKLDSGHKHKLIEEQYLHSDSSNDVLEQPKIPKHDSPINQDHHFDQIARNSFKSRTAWSGSESDDTNSESESFDSNQKRRSDPDCQSIDSLDEEHVFVSNYGRCLRRTPARSSAAAAAALCSSDHSQPRTASSPFINYIDISDSTSPEESLSSSPELLLSNQKLKNEKEEEDKEEEEDEDEDEDEDEEEEDEKDDEEEEREEENRCNEDDTSNDQHGSVKSSRTSSPIHWMPPPEHWTPVPGCLLDQIVVTDVISSDSKITVKECRTKHGFFRNFPPKMKRIKQEK